MTSEIFSDKEILNLFRSEKTREKAFRIIVTQFSRPLYARIRAVVNSHDEADDILQNTFVKAWRALDGFKSESNLYTWLYKIATNEALNFLRNNRKNFSVSLDNDNLQFETLYEKVSSYEDISCESGDEIREKLSQAVESLPEKQRKVFELKYFKEMKYEEMSDELKTSVGALKASYHLAVKKIEKFLELFS